MSSLAAEERLRRADEIAEGPLPRANRAATPGAGAWLARRRCTARPIARGATPGVATTGAATTGGAAKGSAAKGGAALALSSGHTREGCG